MRYYKNIESSFLLAIGTGDGCEEINKAEYDSLSTMISGKPHAPDGYQYRLRADTLEWELAELPPAEDEELDAGEALDIILGGAE